jgi:hypothetical protein
MRPRGVEDNHAGGDPRRGRCSRSKRQGPENPAVTRRVRGRFVMRARLGRERRNSPRSPRRVGARCHSDESQPRRKRAAITCGHHHAQPAATVERKDNQSHQDDLSRSRNSEGKICQPLPGHACHVQPSPAPSILQPRSATADFADSAARSRSRSHYHGTRCAAPDTGAREPHGGATT